MVNPMGQVSICTQSYGIFLQSIFIYSCFGVAVGREWKDVALGPCLELMRKLGRDEGEGKRAAALAARKVKGARHVAKLMVGAW